MSGNQLFANNASALLASNLTTIATTVALASGYGALFPSPTGSQYFIAAIEDNAGHVEYVKCTGRSTDNLTVVRGQEGTSAQAFTANAAVVEIRPTAGTDAGFLQKTGDVMTGPLNMSSQNVTNAVIGSGSSIEAASEIVNTPIRGLTGVSTNQIQVPTDGTSRATASGLPILCQGDPIPAFTIGQIMMWFGALASVPTFWHACDGTSPTNSLGHAIPTPNLVDQFVVGAGGTFAPTAGVTGGASSYTLPAPSLAGTIDTHALTIAEMPSHNHQVWAASGAYGGGSGYLTMESDHNVVSYNNTNTFGAVFIQTTGGPASPGGAIGPGTAHTHGTTGLTCSATSVTNVVPPFVGLIYIMYIG